MPAKIFDWIFGSDENCRLMAEAWINGYTVKKESPDSSVVHQRKQKRFNYSVGNVK
nr:DUF1642 domain-containing protein [Streptococcus dysgalactiae]